MFRNIIMLIILAGTPGLLMAQSEFVEDDRISAVGFCGSIVAGSRAQTIYGLNAGISTAGRVDIGISGEMTSNGDNNNQGMGLYVNNFAFKQKAFGMPLSLAIGFGVFSYSGNASVYISAEAMKYFQISSVIRVQPIIGGSFCIYNNYYNVSSSSFQISLPISVRFNNGVTIFIGPAFANSQNYGAFGALFGMVFELH